MYCRNKGNKAEGCLFEEILEVKGSAVMRCSQGTQISFQYFTSLPLLSALLSEHGILLECLKVPV